jgi:hypothetical protein
MRKLVPGPTPFFSQQEADWAEEMSYVKNDILQSRTRQKARRICWQMSPTLALLTA